MDAFKLKTGCEAYNVLRSIERRHDAYLLSTDDVVVVILVGTNDLMHDVFYNEVRRVRQITHP